MKRKSGFLFPRMSTAENLGFGLSIPYYQTLSPHMDATMTVTGYTTQGAMIEAEFRQRFRLGEHTLRGSPDIHQVRPDAFSSNTSDAEVDQRGLVQSKAEFKINPRWTFGWDVMVQSDNNFARTDLLDGLDDPVHQPGLPDPGSGGGIPSTSAPSISTSRTRIRKTRKRSSRRSSIRSSTTPIIIPTRCWAASSRSPPISPA